MSCKEIFYNLTTGNLPLKHKKPLALREKQREIYIFFIAPALQLPFEHPAGVSYQQRQYVQFVG